MEREARERVEEAFHQEDAEKHTADETARELQVPLEEIAAAGPIRALQVAAPAACRPRRVSLVEAVEDPDGRRVELTEERWEHVLEPDRHPELEPYQAEVLQAVSTPDHRESGRRANEEWFFRRGVGPSRWLQVVVAYERERGWIVTAFARRTGP